MTRRQALQIVGLIAGGAAAPGARWAWPQTGGTRPTLTIDLGQWGLILVRHPIFGREAYAVDPAEIARALTEEA